MNTADWVAPLLELQELDIKVAKISAQLSLIPGKMEEAKGVYQAESQACADAKKHLQDIELSIRKIEGEILAVKEQKRNFQSKTALIKNNDEYRAALIQIEMCDKTVSEYEDKQLEAMQKQEEAQQVLKEKTETLNEAKHRAEGICDDLEMSRRNCETQIADLTGKRVALAAAVAPEILSKYDRLRLARNNVKTRPCFVPVTDDICGRCRVTVTPQIASSVSKGVLEQCGSCGALLYHQ